MSEKKNMPKGDGTQADPAELVATLLTRHVTAADQGFRGIHTGADMRTRHSFGLAQYTWGSSWC